jgi:hypothetical protein
MEDLDYLQNRIDRLEKRQRQLIAGCLGLLLGGVYLVLGHQAVAKGDENVIEARRFVVVDEDGKRRGELGVSSSSAGLTLYDRAGRERIRVELALGASDEKPRVMIFDPPLTLRAVLGSYVVHLGTEDVVFDRPSASLVFYGSDREVLWRAPEEPWVDVVSERMPGP